MRKFFISALSLLLFLPVSSFSADGFATELRSSGYSLIPAPQKVSLDGGEVLLDQSWGLLAEAGAEHVAVSTLAAKAAELHGLKLEASEAGQKAIVLKVAPGTVNKTDEALSIKPMTRS